MASHKKLTRNFYNNLDYYFKSKHVKIGELEKALNVSKGYISRLKNNKRCMSLEMAMDIAEYFDTTLDHMLVSEEWVDNDIKQLEARLVELKKIKKGVIL